ncbi:MAG: intradiol ring-cleavage dioxygenase [Alphaproteobacteria bacterium]|nr:intradiol ring-cleavage dioxygenase [Alphaproteobacteria bacterium]
MSSLVTRRLVLAALPAAALIRPSLAQPTPSCGHATIAQTEGPFFKTRSPLRTSLIEPGMAGTRLHLTGLVLNRNCQPVGGAMLEFWQSDAAGQYDNAGFRLRGHQLADQHGRFDLTTIFPARYPGRTPHIHVKVAAPGRRPLTTQLYFPGDPGNLRDGIYRRELEMTLTRGSELGEGRFDFVLDFA